MSRVIHIFSLDGKNSIEVDYTETPEQTKEQDGKTYYFYNYGSKIWANVKCQANGAISYWTWIPRYAYNESGTTTDTDVIFVTTDNKQLNGSELPSGYSVAGSFINNQDMGIWVSKYEPSSN